MDEMRTLPNVTWINRYMAEQKHIVWVDSTNELYLPLLRMDSVYIEEIEIGVCLDFRIYGNVIR